MIDDFNDTESFEGNTSPDTKPEAEPTPDEIEVEVENTEYVLESVPDEPNGYAIDKKVTEAEGFDTDLLESFTGAAHSERITQGQLEKTINWWNEKGCKFGRSGFGEDFMDSFMGFAGRQKFTEGQVKGLTKWFAGISEKHDRQLQQVKDFHRKAHGRSGSESRAAAIARVRSSKAYTDRLDPHHKDAVRLMHELTQGRKVR